MLDSFCVLDLKNEDGSLIKMNQISTCAIQNGPLGLYQELYEAQHNIILKLNCSDGTVYVVRYPAFNAKNYEN